MKTIKNLSALVMGAAILASCNGNSKTTSDSDSTSCTSCTCGSTCDCSMNPCDCNHIDEGGINSATANGDMIAFFNNGEYLYLQLGNDDATNAKLFDADKKEIAKGKMMKDESNEDKLIYSFDNDSKLSLYLKEPKMDYQKGSENKSFVLISPNQEVYTSANDTITAIYRPEISVTLVGKDGMTVLPMVDSHAKGATYKYDDLEWIASMNKATLKKDGKTIEYVTDGKSVLPSVVYSK